MRTQLRLVSPRDARVVRSRVWRTAILVTALAFSTGVAAEDGWGNLKGRFVLNGKPPVPRPIKLQPGTFCGMLNLLEEDLVVSANGGVQNAVVYLYTRPRDQKPDVHPELTVALKTMDNFNCRFEPRIVSVMTGQDMDLVNSDPVAHNVNVTTLAQKNPGRNVLIPAKKSVAHRFTVEETLPVRVVCNIHPWMTGYIVVKDHPYVAISDAEGNFEIKNIPVGTWKFRAWQEKVGFVSKVNLKGSDTDWRRGQFEVTIRSDETVDLGTIKVTL